MMLRGSTTSFNGVRLSCKERNIITTEQNDKIKSLTLRKTDKEFSGLRTDAQYIGVNCGPKTGARYNLWHLDQMTQRGKR